MNKGSQPWINNAIVNKDACAPQAPKAPWEKTHRILTEIKLLYIQIFQPLFKQGFGSSRGSDHCKR